MIYYILLACSSVEVHKHLKETLMGFYQITQCYNSEQHIPHSYCFESLKSNIVLFVPFFKDVSLIQITHLCTCC
jgi:hypothetical protein